MRQIPTDEKTCEETAERKHNLPRGKIEEVEQRTVAYLQETPLAQRQRTYCSHHRTHRRDNPRGTPAGGVHLLMHKGSTNLVQRDERRKRGQSQQGIKGHGHDVAHNGHARESLLKDVDLSRD